MDVVQKPAQVVVGSCAGDAPWWVLGKGNHCPLSWCLSEKGLVQRTKGWLSQQVVFSFCAWWWVEGCAGLVSLAGQAAGLVFEVSEKPGLSPGARAPLQDGFCPALCHIGLGKGLRAQPELPVPISCSAPGPHSAEFWLPSAPALT